MSLKFRKIQRKVLLGADAGKVKTHAMARARGYCDMQKLCKLVAGHSTVSSADVKAVLDSLNWVMDIELQSGNIVQVGELGNFRLTIKSEAVEGEEKFNTSHIRKSRIVFTPGSSLRKTNRDMTFEWDKPEEENEPEDGNKEEPEGV